MIKTKCLCVIIPFIFLISVFNVSAEVSANSKTTIAFLGFNTEDISVSGAVILSELVRNELVVSQKYDVIDRENMNLLLTEIEFQLSGLTDKESSLSVGNLLGVKKLMSGTIGQLGKLYIITLKIIDVETGKIDSFETEEFVGVMEDLRKPVRTIVQKLLNIDGIEVNRGAFIHVTTKPEGVNIYVDGLFEGSSPAKIKVPGTGEYHVKLYASEFEEWHQKVTVDENSTFFVNAIMLKRNMSTEVDDRVRALQDGRTSFIISMSLYSTLVTEAFIFSSGTDNSRFYFGLPLLITPGVFFLSLNATNNTIMNAGRSFMIVSSILWGSTLGFTSGLVLLPENSEDIDPDYWRPFAFASAAGGIVYGTAAFLLTWENAFPSSRVWFINLGSFMGSLIGLGVPFMFNVESRPLLFGLMAAGSTLGGGLAVFLTQHIASEGANVENLSFGSFIEAGKQGISPGIPLPVFTGGTDGKTPGVKFTLFHYSD